MSLKPTKPRSIASRLVILFTSAAAVLLGCGLGVFYVLVVRHAVEEDNEFLADKVTALRADLQTPDWLSSLQAELKAAHPGEPAAYWIRVVDSSGRTVAETSNMSQLLPPALFSSQSADVAIKASRSHRTAGKLFSLTAFDEETDGQTYSVQVAQDRSADDQFIQRFGALFALVLIFGTGAAAVIAMTVTKRGLRPLGQMIKAVQRVQPASLNQRLVPTKWPRELEPLALAFDQMLNRLEDSFRRLSQFSADLAHELRTPVANLLGEAQVTLSRDRRSEDYRQVIESSVAECERLSAIIDNLLFLARAEAAKEQINITRFDARLAIENIAGFYQTAAEEQHITFICKGEGDVEADSTLFGRAVANLIENALRFTPAGGTIQIGIAATRDQCQVSVQDNGAGISKEHLPHIFDRLYRGDASRSSKGSGLGLSLVKSITELHGGEIALQSEENLGTTVTLSFPNRVAAP